MDKLVKTASPKIGIIIVNLNRKEDLERCLETLTTSVNVNMEIILVDNASTDGSPEMVNLRFPQVIVLRQPHNLGFTGGNNLGMQYAMEHGAEYLFLLNNDAVVEPPTLHTLLAAAQSNPNAAFLGPKVLTLEQPNIILSAGARLVDGWKPVQRGIGEVDIGQYDAVSEVDYLMGCAILTPASIICKIGLLDEDFFAYNEDSEWCVRARRAGYSVLFIPQARVWHPDTRLRDELSPHVTYYIFRNNLLLAKKAQLGSFKIVKILVEYIRTILSWSIKPRWKNKRKQRDILLYVLRDFFLSNYGAMKPDVQKACKSK